MISVKVVPAPSDQAGSREIGRWGAKDRKEEEGTESPGQEGACSDLGSMFMLTEAEGKQCKKWDGELSPSRSQEEIWGSLAQVFVIRLKFCAPHL